MSDVVHQRQADNSPHHQSQHQQRIQHTGVNCIRQIQGAFFPPRHSRILNSIFRLLVGILYLWRDF